MDFCRKYKLKVCIKSGFDCRLFTQEHLDMMKGIKFVERGLRFAFDNLSQEGHIQRTLTMCNKSGIGKARMMIYVLYNFEDTPLEAEYRMREVIRCGGRPYPMRYTPIFKLEKKPAYVGKYWTEKLSNEFRQFYHIPRWFMMRDFTEWLKRTGKPELLEDYYRYEWSKP